MKQSPHAVFKHLSHQIEEIASMYFSSKKQISETNIYSFSSGETDAFSPYHLLISRVERAFDQLDNVEKDFINNDFFDESYPFWWANIYPKCTYYRYKRKAMTHFLEAYEN
ncbi:MAG: hypothetical protein PHU89_02465 [Bacilli bacterium]|jgi:hypothetical protein|nr:hypothetical protein [Bacilli bacterium]